MCLRMMSVQRKITIDGLYPTLEDERGQNGVYYACIEGA